MSDGFILYPLSPFGEGALFSGREEQFEPSFRCEVLKGN